ncbi:UNVERIFIED_CONTAM: hypothetical protein GTU68_040045 [Idotea baltica]|nr:hypothetical protein [Idotea baltica]
MSFASLGLSPYLVNALIDQHYTNPYPIQQKAIPAILAQKDVLGIAQTGSGKTASYVLPILMNLADKTVVKNRYINVLVLVPTRELAVQVNDVFKQFEVALPRPIKSMAVHGGVSINPQMKSLQNVSILVATPGRLLALKLRRNGIEASAIHSKKSQGNRNKTLGYFKSGELPVLVSTDLLARGIDIEFLPYVINYELPRSPKDFVHRIGRTGRAENPGEAISFVTAKEQHHFKVIQKKMKKWVTLIDADSLDLKK